MISSALIVCRSRPLRIALSKSNSDTIPSTFPLPSTTGKPLYIPERSCNARSRPTALGVAAVTRLFMTSRAFIGIPPVYWECEIKKQYVRHHLGASFLWNIGEDTLDSFAIVG